MALEKTGYANTLNYSIFLISAMTVTLLLRKLYIHLTPAFNHIAVNLTPVIFIRYVD